MMKAMQEEKIIDNNSYLQTYEFIPWEKLHKKRILITGATGLIGQALVRILLAANERMQLNLKVLAWVRSQEKAESIFENQYCSTAIKYIVGSVEQLPEIEEDIDYIIYGANPNSSRFYIYHPVETLRTAVYGTDNLLRLAREKNVEGFVYLSTMESHGVYKKGVRITEENGGQFDATTIKNCYPLVKQCCENLCCSYSVEYQVPVKIVYLTQTFGPGVNYYDGRIFAELARCVVERRDIVLKIKGRTKRAYLYTEDAASAILIILLKGETGQSYTAANEETYCSVDEMASLVAGKYGIQVELQEQDIKSQGYAATQYMNLDTAKLRKLGWKPQVGLEEMYDRMIQFMKTKK